MTPTPETIKATREALGMTQEQAAAIVFSSRRAWQNWEGGQQAIHPAIWKLFLIETKRARDKLAKTTTNGEK